MPRPPKTPADLVRRFAALRARERAEEFAKGREAEPAAPAWISETHCLPREAAADMARDRFERFPKEAYRTEVERWEVLEDGRIEITIRRLAEAGDPAVKSL